jgi:hypothetical protein
MPQFIYLWGWHPSKVERMKLSHFWMCCDVADQIKKARQGGWDGR